MTLSATSTHLLITSRAADSTTFPGSPFQCLTTLSMNKFFQAKPFLAQLVTAGGSSCEMCWVTTYAEPALCGTQPTSAVCRREWHCVPLLPLWVVKPKATTATNSVEPSKQDSGKYSMLESKPLLFFSFPFSHLFAFLCDMFVTVFKILGTK